MNKILLTFVFAFLFSTTAIFAITTIDNRPTTTQSQMDQSTPVQKDVFQKPNLDKPDFKDATNVEVNKNVDTFKDTKGVDVKINTTDTRFVPGRGVTIVEVRELLRGDRALVPFVDSIDAIDCGNSFIVFGVVDSAQVRTNIENKIKSLEGIKGKTFQNKIMVKP